MEVRIGIHNTARELVLETTESADDIEKLVKKAVTDEHGILAMTDDKGRSVLVTGQNPRLHRAERAGCPPGRVRRQLRRLRPADR